MKYLVLLLLLAPLTYAKDIKLYHSNVKCAQCHENNTYTELGITENCISCHGDMASIAKKTKHENGKNPHDNHHYGTDMSCTSCHNEHKANNLYCDQCHNFKYKNFN